MPAPSVPAAAPDVTEAKTSYWDQGDLRGGSEASDLNRVGQALSPWGAGNGGGGGCGGPLLGSFPRQQGWGC